MSKLHDPLFSNAKKAMEATASVHEEVAAAGFAPATVGGISGPKIPVLIDVKDRLCVPVPEK